MTMLAKMESTGFLQKKVISDQTTATDMMPVITAIVFRKYCRRKHSQYHSERQFLCKFWLTLT